MFSRSCNSLDANQILDRLQELDEKESDELKSAESIDVYFTPPEVAELTDEDSGDEDNGRTFNNLNSNQFRADAELVLQSQHQEILRISDKT